MKPRLALPHGFSGMLCLQARGSNWHNERSYAVVKAVNHALPGRDQRVSWAFWPDSLVNSPSRQEIKGPGADRFFRCLLQGGLQLLQLSLWVSASTRVENQSISGRARGLHSEPLVQIEPVACIVVTCSSVDMILSRPTSYLFKQLAPTLTALRNTIRASGSSAANTVHDTYTSRGLDLILDTSSCLLAKRPGGRRPEVRNEVPSMCPGL